MERYLNKVYRLKDNGQIVRVVDTTLSGYLVVKILECKGYDLVNVSCLDHVVEPTTVITLQNLKSDEKIFRISYKTPVKWCVGDFAVCGKQTYRVTNINEEHGYKGLKLVIDNPCWKRYVEEK